MINGTELRCIGLRRSGHHAILNWIQANIAGGFCFINDCQPGRNPFNLDRLARYPDRRYRTNIPEFDLVAECAGLHCRKDFLLYNYEEKDLREIESPPFEEKHDQWIGPSERVVSLLILRDPFNNLASRLMMEDRRRSVRELPGSSTQLSRSQVARIFVRPRQLVRKIARRFAPRDRKRRDVMAEVTSARDLFKSYAREYLGDTEILQNVLPINYNRWFEDCRYRRELADVLGLASAGRGLNRVAKWGAGSSFDGKRYDGSARDMKVLDRWRKVIDDPRYRSLIDDPELHELSHRIFGAVLDPWDWK